MNVSSNNKAEFDGSGRSEWLSTKGGTRHFLRIWQAEKSTAYVVYLHGIEGHSLWFQDTAIFLQQAGITTVALDRRGSGMSKEARGDAKNWQQLLNDTIEILQHCHRQAGSVPVFLMANCWGAKLAALIAESQQAESKLISGLIFSSPAIEVKVDLSLAEKLGVVWRLLTGSKASFRIPLEVEDFTDNPHYLKYIQSDPLRLTEATASFLFASFILTIMSKKSPPKILLPTLVLQSGTDSIVEANGVKTWFEKIAAKDKTFEVFPNCLHSLDFDRNPEEYRNLLLKWILERAGQNNSLQQNGTITNPVAGHPA